MNVFSVFGLIVLLSFGRIREWHIFHVHSVVNVAALMCVCGRVWSSDFGHLHIRFKSIFHSISIARGPCTGCVIPNAQVKSSASLLISTDHFVDTSSIKWIWYQFSLSVSDRVLLELFVSISVSFEMHINGNTYTELCSFTNIFSKSPVFSQFSQFILQLLYV